MSIIQGNAHTSAGGGYNIERSLRFNSADSAYLNRTFSSGSRTTWTLSMWLKRSAFNAAAARDLFTVNNGTTDATYFVIAIRETDKLRIEGYNTIFRETTQVLRDVSAWYHLVVTLDTTNGTAGNRIKMYLNGVEINTFSTSNNPTSSQSLGVNQAASHRIGALTSTYFDGYLTEVNFIDGQALTPSSFGETDSATGVWKPKSYTGTYGTNGFELNFSDNSNTTAATLGKDISGNGNNWTPNNFSVTAGAGNDSLVDSPTAYGTDTGVGGEVRGNYATLNPLDGSQYGANVLTLSNGNLQATGINASANRTSTINLPSGKWYMEFTAGTISAPVTSLMWFGAQDVNGFTGNATGYNNSGQIVFNGSSTTGYATFTTNDIIGCAFDITGNTATYYKNGTQIATGTLGVSTKTYTVWVQMNSNGDTLTANFGQRAFAYTAPSGFKALCTTNLPTPTIGATSTTQANDYFNAVLYTGNGSTQSITGVGFQPDWVWLKSRSNATDHELTDAVRGATKSLISNSTAAEATDTNGLTAFNSDGFSLGTDANYNGSARTFVSWNWNAGGSTVTNTSGTISAQVRANTTSGFSIATYTGNGSGGATVGHGLGVSPAMVFTKSRSNSTNWMVWHQNLTANYAFEGLNTTGAEVNGGSPSKYVRSVSSTLVTIGNDISVNQSASYTYVMYCFAAVAGYSAFGSYTGNGSTDGPFVYTGFRPAYVLIKYSSGTADWIVLDENRPGYNVIGGNLYPSASSAEDTQTKLDILSNGFKIRADSSNANVNVTSGTYIYACFAEFPFKYALAR